MQKDKNLVLDEEQIMQKIKRIAFEVYEQNFEESTIVLAGIVDMGYQVAGLLQAQLQAISPLSVELLRIELDKLAPTQGHVQLNRDRASCANKVVIIIDDVFNTGRTLAYSMGHFLQVPVKKLQVAVLVDRGHHSFPIQPDYVGYGLSTTVNERIEVRLAEGAQTGVYLY